MLPFKIAFVQFVYFISSNFSISFVNLDYEHFVL